MKPSKTLSKSFTLGIAAVALLTLASRGHAADTAFVWSYHQYDADSTAAIGTAFTVGDNDLDVTEIGAYLNPPRDADSVTVGQTTTEVQNTGITVNLYNLTAGTLVDSVYISDTVPQVANAQGFIYVPFTYTLQSGVSYAITDFVGVANDTQDDTNGNNDTPYFWAYNAEGQQIESNPDITDLVRVSSPGNDPSVVPTKDTGANGNIWLGGNFVYTVAPEPSTWAMLLGGLSFLAWMSRRKLQA